MEQKMDKKGINEVFLLYGPPASGKTTIAGFLSEIFNAKYISVGAITRKEITKKTNLGKELKEYLDKVVEYPASLISAVVDKEIRKFKSGFNTIIIDGFPKYSSEIPAFLQIIKNKQIEIGGIFIVDLPFSIVKKRSESRRICGSCLSQQDKNEDDICNNCGGRLEIREDDTEYILKRRYSDYLNSIQQLSESLFPTIKNIIHIKGEKSKSEIKKELESKLPE